MTERENEESGRVNQGWGWEGEAQPEVIDVPEEQGRHNRPHCSSGPRPAESEDAQLLWARPAPLSKVYEPQLPRM